MKRMFGKAAAALAASATLLPVGAMAQVSDNWTIEASINGYLPTIGGKTTFPSNGGGSDLNMDVGTILDHLKFVFMGSIQVRNGLWGGFLDVLYLDLGASKSGFRDLTIGSVELPVGASANASADIKSTVATLAGTYRAIATPETTLDVLGGVRHLKLRESLDYSIVGNVGSIPLPGRAGSRAVGQDSWDAVIGAKGKVFFGDEKKWFAPYYADIGTGNSQLTYQLQGGVGYAFTWGDVTGSWRYLNYNMKSGGPIESLNLNGPQIAATFRW